MYAKRVKGFDGRVVGWICGQIVKCGDEIDLEGKRTLVRAVIASSDLGTVVALATPDRGRYAKVGYSGRV